MPIKRIRKRKKETTRQMWQNIPQVWNLVTGKKRFSLYDPCSLSLTIFQKKELKNKIPENKCDKICVRPITEECQILLREK